MGTGLPLSEAAAASGFADQAHMTRVFVARYGFTPGAWKDGLLSPSRKRGSLALDKARP
jgi:AraC-like DNA-binding protein